ncbi:hypothetical protein ACHAWF_002854 [Thalassiosira exigua]
MRMIGLPTLILPFGSTFEIAPTLTSSSPWTCRSKIRKPSPTAILAYGKGSEIWPECNEEPILLSASFPGSKIPQPAKHLLESSVSDASAPSSASVTPGVDIRVASSPLPIVGRRRRAVRKTLSHLLKSAASASIRRARTAMEHDDVPTYGVPPPAIGKGPGILALILLGTQCVRANHVVAVIGMSLYFMGLASWCAAPKLASTEHNPIVNMPSLPSKGHVPNLITNPLGGSLTSSRAYRNWLRVGAFLGILLPSVILSQLVLAGKSQAISAILEWTNVEHAAELKRLVGGPMFLLCCQAMTEAVARTALLPLPIRILIPVSYNSLRLSSLQSWAFPTVQCHRSLQAVGVANLLYWYANLFFFLIPVGVVRYLRAHFFCVEAVEVTVRKGAENSVGLLP